MKIKTILLYLCSTLIVSQSFGQKSVSSNETNEEYVYSKVSMGVSLINQIDPTNPVNDGWKPNGAPQPGFGIELDMNYAFNKKFNVSMFVRGSFIRNDFLLLSGSSSNVMEKAKDYFIGGGAILEYKISFRLAHS